MSKKNRNKRASQQQNRAKPTYKGPYQDNPNLSFQNVKKSMRPEADGPTVDTFSSLDSTTNILPNEENDLRSSSEQQKRPTKEKKITISFEGIIILIVSLLATGIGIIVYTHGNKFVAVEKDINYIQDDLREQKVQIQTIETNTLTIDRKVDLLRQEVELEKVNNR